MSSQSSDRLMSIIESFLVDSQQSLSEVAFACKLEPPTAMRYLRQLVERGWLERDESTKVYTLGVALVTIGDAAQAARPILTRALPYMRQVLSSFDETVNIAMEHRGDVIVIESLESGRSIRRGATVGEVDGWFDSSLGKSILAFMPEADVVHLFEQHPPVKTTEKTLLTREAVLDDLAQIRQRGYALDDEESEVGLMCVGAPIWGAGNQVTHAISVSGPTQRVRNRLDEIVGALQSAAAEISLANKGVSS